MASTRAGWPRQGVIEREEVRPGKVRGRIQVLSGRADEVVLHVEHDEGGVALQVGEVEGRDECAHAVSLPHPLATSQRQHPEGEGDDEQRCAEHVQEDQQLGQLGRILHVARAAPSPTPGVPRCPWR